MVWAEAKMPAWLKNMPIVQSQAIENSGANKMELSFEKLRLLKKKKPGIKSSRIMIIYAQRKVSHIENAF